MKNKRGRPRSPLSQDEALRDRIAILLNAVFGGNQLRAATALGVPQPTMSRVLAGKRPPTAHLLKRLAGYAGVNARYVYHGEGDPLSPSTAGTLPVSDVIIPPDGMGNSTLFSGDRHPVAAALDGPCRYWLRLSDVSAIVLRLSPRFLPGDLLLIDTSRDRLDRVDAVDGQLCAVRLSVGKYVEFQLAHIVFDGDTLRASPFGRPELAEPKLGTHEFVPHRRVHRKRTIGKLKKNRDTTVDRPAQQAPPPSDHRPAAPTGFLELSTLGDVVGISVLQERRLPLWD